MSNILKRFQGIASGNCIFAANSPPESNCISQALVRDFLSDDRKSQAGANHHTKTMADIRIPRIETLIIAVFFLSVGLWGINQCSAERTQMTQKFEETAGTDAPQMLPEPENEIPAPEAAPDPAPESKTPEPVAGPEKPRPKPGKRPELTNNIRPMESKAEPAKPQAAGGGVLYVTIEGLRMRSEPGLRGELVAKLRLYEPVVFLDEKTSWTQEINLGTEKVTDHWVKVKTESGKEGWVFGAGVHFYKKKI
ncbi:MAG: SH3 domain-containing protein [Saprospiraceae bacterium]